MGKGVRNKAKEVFRVLSGSWFLHAMVTGLGFILSVWEATGGF